MTHRQNSFRPRNYSSCSNSSSASVSPSSSSTLNFTLYGGPAPRSLHRTTTGAAKSKPKRRSNKPTPPPPTSPSLCCPDDGNFHDFKLDLSSLSIEDETIIVSNGTEIYYSEHNVLVQNSLETSHHDVSDIVMSPDVNVHDVHMNKCQNNYQVLDDKKCGNNGTGSNSTRSSSTESDKDLISQTCSELDLSSQGYLEILFSNDSYRSNVSNSSSYITVSECSVSSLSSMPSSYSSKQSIDKNNHAERIDPVNHIENGPSENDSSASRISRMSENESKNVEDVIKIETGNGDRRILSCNEAQCIKKKSQYESSFDNTRYLRKEKPNLEYRTIEDTNSIFPEMSSFAVNSGRNCKESSQVNNLIKTKRDFDVMVPKQLFTVETDSQNFCPSTPSSTSFTPYEANYSINYDNSDKGQSTNSCDQPELYGYYVFGEDHETPSYEWTVEDESGSFSDDLCSNEEISLENYGCLIKSESLLKGGKIPFQKFSKINENSFSVRNANSCQESLFAAKLSPHSLTSGNCLETGSSMSELHFRTLPKNQISSMNDSKTVCETLNHITADETNMKVQSRVVSAPIHSRPIDSIRSSAVPLDSERRTMFLLESFESGYFSEIPAPDITMTAGDIMEAVLYARQLVRVLERTLDKALSSAGNMSATTTPFRNQYVENRNKNRRCRSLSPNLLRHSKEMSNSVTLASSENCVLSTENESGVEGLKSQPIEETVKLDCGYEKRLSCEGKCDGSKCCKPCIISITPEQLQQQRALLKPAAQRSLQETVAQVLDMADILKSVISKRRLVMDPSEELICGTNRSVSEWSLENSPRNDN